MEGPRNENRPVTAVAEEVDWMTNDSNAIATMLDESRYAECYKALIAREVGLRKYLDRGSLSEEDSPIRGLHEQQMIEEDRTMLAELDELVDIRKKLIEQIPLRLQEIAALIGENPDLAESQTMDLLHEAGEIRALLPEENE